MTNKGGVVKIKCVGNSKVVINGQSVTKEQQLHHHDRVLFGSSHLYVFHSPQVSKMDKHFTQASTNVI